MAQGKRVWIGGKVHTIPAHEAPRFDEMHARLSELYPGDEQARSAALQAVARYLLDAPAPATIEVGRSPSDAQRAAREILDARKASAVERLAPVGDARRTAQADAQAAYVAAGAVAALAAEDGLTEREAGKLAGIDKLTVRKFQGKRDRA
ncbi:hypothetical protein BKG86_17310 [Mycobacteroides chelonae]|uniref:hypothetical protein n=1 Tax=Mycobacteroides chelonae TaxID=1774 RepID=UPI0008A9872C|nr:hypothetical protein [Mycobacteroides chelonae]OHU71410.1 hypothetical protein BKG86_17310 [Mycobacteroides chelonae]